MRFAVVGHVEWCTFAPVSRIPEAGQIESSPGAWEQAAGGGAVAAVQIAKLAGECLFVTALGEDELGRRARAGLEELGVRVEAAWRPTPQRRAFVHIDPEGERAITTIGARLAPRADDDLPWAELEGADAVYLTAGDAGAIRAARAARTLVATTRVGATLPEAGVELDALVASATDRGEAYARGDLDPVPRWAVLTDGANGGRAEGREGGETAWSAAPLPGPRVDTYGAGDSFAGGLTFGMGSGMPLERALELAARCGAACVAGRGPYSAQLAA